jgi:hypothetical protein
MRLGRSGRQGNGARESRASAIEKLDLLESGSPVARRQLIRSGLLLSCVLAIEVERCDETLSQPYIRQRPVGFPRFQIARGKARQSKLDRQFERIITSRRRKRAPGHQAPAPVLGENLTLWRCLLSGNQLHSPVLRAAFFGAVRSDKICFAIAVRRQPAGRYAIFL